MHVLVMGMSMAMAVLLHVVVPPRSLGKVRSHKLHLPCLIRHSCIACGAHGGYKAYLIPVG